MSKLTVKRAKVDSCGNSRYIVSWVELGIQSYETPKSLGMAKYRGKDFGGGFVFQSSALSETLKQWHANGYALAYTEIECY